MGTELSFLFRRNAEICAEMSTSAKSIEVREQWTELAAHWRQKAEANEALAVTAAVGRKPTPAPISAPRKYRRRASIVPI
jgi:hypothetical protein